MCAQAAEMRLTDDQPRPESIEYFSLLCKRRELQLILIESVMGIYNYTRKNILKQSSIVRELSNYFYD